MVRNLIYFCCFTTLVWSYSVGSADYPDSGNLIVRMKCTDLKMTESFESSRQVLALPDATLDLYEKSYIECTPDDGCVTFRSVIYHDYQTMRSDKSYFSTSGEKDVCQKSGKCSSTMTATIDRSSGNFKAETRAVGQLFDPWDKPRTIITTGKCRPLTATEG